MNSCYPCKCPACRRMLNAAITMDGYCENPGPDDITLCIFCGACLRFKVDGINCEMDGTLRLATRCEIRNLPREQLQTLSKTRKTIRATRPNWRNPVKGMGRGNSNASSKTAATP